MKLPYRRPILLACRIPSHCRGVSSANATSPLICTSLNPRRHCPSRGPSTQQRHLQRTVATNAAALNKASATDPSPENDEPSIPLSDQVRFLMRQVPHPVAIITATDPDSPTDRAFRGMTVSSFNTVTLYPDPVISFNVKRPSETLQALQTSGRFLVHLLSPSETTAKLAREFSRGNDNLHISSGQGDFEFFSGSGEEGRAPPRLRRKQTQTESSLVDFPFIFECRAHTQKIEVHDHTIVLGTIVQTLQRPSRFNQNGSGNGVNDDAHAPEDLCLTYADTRFWKMGEEI